MHVQDLQKSSCEVQIIKKNRQDFKAILHQTKYVLFIGKAGDGKEWNRGKNLPSTYSFPKKPPTTRARPRGSQEPELQLGFLATYLGHHPLLPVHVS